MNKDQTSTIFPKHLKFYTSKQDLNYFKVYTIEYQLVKDLSKFLKFSYEIRQILVNSSDPMVSQSKGSSVDVFNAYYQNREADDIATDVIPHENEVQGTSFPYEYDVVTFLSNKPEHLARSFASVHTFEWAVWSGVILTLLSMSLLLYFFLGSSYGKILMHAYKSLLGDSFELKMRRASVKLAVMSWLLFVFFVTNSFKSVLLASLSAPRLEGVRDIDELVAASNNPNFFCLSPLGTVRRFIMTSEREEVMHIRDCLTRTLKDPIVERVNLYTFLRNNDIKKAYIMRKATLLRLRHEAHVSDDFFYTVSFALAARKDFCCLEQLNIMIQRMLAAGLFQAYRLRTKAFIKMSVIKTSTYKEEPLVKPLTLKNLSGVFIILAAGHALSVVVFVFEILLYKKNRNSISHP